MYSFLSMLCFGITLFSMLLFCGAFFSLDFWHWKSWFRREPCKTLWFVLHLGLDSFSTHFCLSLLHVVEAMGQSTEGSDSGTHLGQSKGHFYLLFLMLLQFYQFWKLEFGIGFRLFLLLLFLIKIKSICWHKNPKALRS